jgi:predicted nucleotidyltransferase
VVDFKAGTVHSLLDLARMEDELETLFGRHVDLVPRKALEQSRNYIRRKEILSSLERVYVA